MDVTIIVSNGNFLRAKIRGYLGALVLVVEKAVRAYHVERLAFSVLKDTARSRAQYFLKFFFAGMDRRGKLHSRRRSENG